VGVKIVSSIQSAQEMVLVAKKEMMGSNKILL
jgi:hypothetical protein